MKLTNLIEEASRFEKEIKKQPFDKQVEWRRKLTANQWKSINPKSNGSIRDYQKNFNKLNIMEHKFHNLIEDKSKFLNDFKLAQRNQERGMLQDSKIKENYKYNERINHPKDMLRELKGNKNFLQNAFNKNNKNIDITNNGGYYSLKQDFGPSAIKNKGFLTGDQFRTKGLWVHPEKSEDLSGYTKETYLNRAYMQGDIPGELTGTIENNKTLQPSNDYERIIPNIYFNDIKNLNIEKRQTFGDQFPRDFNRDYLNKISDYNSNIPHNFLNDYPKNYNIEKKYINTLRSINTPSLVEKNNPNHMQDKINELKNYAYEEDRKKRELELEMARRRRENGLD